MPQIKDVLEDLNPWWKGEFKPEIKERIVYKEIKKFMLYPQILAFTGLRRVGKTTLMRKIIQDSIIQGFDSRNIMYFSFDMLQETEIREIIRTYEEMLQKNISKDKVILLFDEVQKLDNWENQIKHIYDTFKPKIILSGSESLFIRKKSKESLAGRIYEFRIDPLSFKEFLLFKEANYKPTGIYHRELLMLFEEYCITQGFPELVGIKEKDVIKKYIREGVVEKILFRDIPRLYNIKDMSVVESLINIIMENPGQIIELVEFSKEMGISRRTISNYFGYLQDSFLIRKLYNYSDSRRKVERKLKKYYPAIVSPDLLFKTDDISKSRVFECIMVNQLKAEFFWRDPYKNEVDIVIPSPKLLPIEIKYGKIEIKGVLSFLRKFKARDGRIISRDKEDVIESDGKNIIIVPAYKFLIEN